MFGSERTLATVIKRRHPISLPVVAGALRLTDLAIVAATSEVLHPMLAADKTFYYSTAEILSVLFAAIVFHINGLYRLKGLNFRHLKNQLTKLTYGWGIVLLSLIVAMFFMKVSEEYSRTWMGAWFVTCLAGMAATRAVLVIRAQHWVEQGRLTKNVIIVGYQQNITERLIERLCADESVWIAGYFDDRVNREGCVSPPTLVTSNAKVDRMGTINDLIEYARQHRVDHIILAFPWSAVRRVTAVADRLSILPVDVSLAPDEIGLSLVQATMTSLCGVPLLGITMKPLGDWQHFIKSVFDLVMGSVLLVALSVPFLLVALAIKLDSPGPVFFRQKRYGFNHHLIGIWKFRTMSSHMCDDLGEKSTERNDPRITRVGRWLRKMSIDEIPQLFNVVKGEMSLVGPRPHALNSKAAGRYFQEVVADYAARHRVKPGITGWAQVNGWRGETTTEDQIRKRVEYDLFYISNWSFTFDLKILFMTLFVLFKHHDKVW